MATAFHPKRDGLLGRRLPIVLGFGDVAEGESELRLGRIGLGRGVPVDPFAGFGEALHERKDSREMFGVAVFRSFQNLDVSPLLFDYAASVALGTEDDEANGDNEDGPENRFAVHGTASVQLNASQLVPAGSGAAPDSALVDRSRGRYLRGRRKDWNQLRGRNRRRGCRPLAHVEQGCHEPDSNQEENSQQDAVKSRERRGRRVGRHLLPCHVRFAPAPGAEVAARPPHPAGPLERGVALGERFTAIRALDGTN
jgi:hypothetical protein